MERGLDPLTTMLVVMSNPESGGGLSLATSPKAKEVLGISNVTRRYEIPDHKDLLIVTPRMNLYIEKNMIINNIFRRYVSDKDLLVYSIDESFVRVSKSKKLFNKTAYEFARQFQQDIYDETGLYCTIGIGDNMLLSKLALDNEAKKNHDMIAEWRYEDVPNTVWKIPNLTDFWGIGTKTERNLNKKGIQTIEELAHYDFFKMKESMGIVGQQLIAHCWGIDRTNISDTYQPKSTSIGNSQVLTRDYRDVNQIKIVLREIAEQVATRTRAKNLKTACVSVGIGYSRNEFEKGFSRQMSISPTNQSKELVNHCFNLFDEHFKLGLAARNISVSFSKLTADDSIQLNLFEEPTEVINNHTLDTTIDLIRKRYGFDSIVHASSHMDGVKGHNKMLVLGH